ncbi:hypothetical protein C8R46DRAFT_1287765 [Mycena filopes]|nr:hypothetical protein C8R46DRAFT_1287765 [Mycena filopes]
MPAPPMTAQGEDDAVYLYPAPAAQPLAPAPTDLSVSNTFLPSIQLNSRLPDLILLSADLCFFYVHSALLENASANAFHNLLPVAYPSPLEDGSEHDYPILHLPETSSVVNILLHAVYGLDCAEHSPTFGTLVRAVDSMQVYGITPKLTILPSTPLYVLLLAHAPHAPLPLYCLAGRHGIDDLAVAASGHLLSFPLARLTDADATNMGPIYLKRQAALVLCFLHVGRTEALKRALLPPPRGHPPTKACSVTHQHVLTREWALAAARLAEDLRPGYISTHALELAMRPLAAQLACELCQKALRARVQNLTAEWAIVKVCPSIFA